MIFLYTTSTCSKCVAVADWLAGHEIPFEPRVIDTDAEAMADALMLGAYSCPALVNGAMLLTPRDIFRAGRIDEERILELARGK